MPKMDGGIARFDIHDPADLAVLISSGVIWQGGGEAVQAAIKALVSGAVPRPADLPPDVAAYLDQQVDEEGQVIDAEEEPVEDSTASPDFE